MTERDASEQGRQREKSRAPPSDDTASVHTALRRLAHRERTGLASHTSVHVAVPEAFQGQNEAVGQLGFWRMPRLHRFLTLGVLHTLGN